MASPCVPPPTFIPSSPPGTAVPSRSHFGSLPPEVRTLIFDFVLSPPHSVVSLCGCHKRQEYTDCQKVVYNTTPIDPKLSLSLINKQSRVDVRHLAPCKQSIQVCDDPECLIWTLRNTSWRFKRQVDSVIITKTHKTVVPICHENRADLVLHYKVETAGTLLWLFRWEMLQHWQSVTIHGCMKVDSFKSLIQVDFTLQADRCLSYMRQRFRDWPDPRDVTWRVEDAELGTGYGGRKRRH